MSMPEHIPLVQNQIMSFPPKRQGIYTSRITPRFVMAGPPGPREARPEDKLHVPATHEHQRWLVWRGGQKRAFWAQSVFMGRRDKPGHDEIWRLCRYLHAEAGMTFRGW
jgi:hypothetical protein